jgi:hypothetical protein
VFAADVGGFHKAYELSNYALAGKWVFEHDALLAAKHAGILQHFPLLVV